MVENMREGEVEEVIRDAYRALVRGDVDRMLSFCTDDVTLDWGPFTFEGEEEVRQWEEELRRMFPEIGILETRLEVHGSTAVHEFIIEVTTPEGRRGILPVTGNYDVKDGKIQRISITLLRGALIVSEAEIKH